MALLRSPVDAKSVRVPVDAKSVRVPVDAKSVRVPVDAKSVRVPVDAKSVLRFFFFLLPFSLFLFSGCHIERIVLEEPVRDQFVEVDTEDHIVVRLDENATAGYKWTAQCSNSFVDIQIEHDEEDDDDACGTRGLATVHLRVRRGFIGPAVVYLRYRRGWSGECVRKIKLQLYRRTTNVAGWM